MTHVFQEHAGSAPLLISMPHSGIGVPDDVRARFTEAGCALPDTDWHLPRLYDFVFDSPAHVLVANYSRYVVDLNRDPSGAQLYPGADNTGLCPTTTFERDEIYRPGQAPGDSEIAERVETYWRPYHDHLRETLLTIRDKWGYAILFDAHSIRARVPRFFEGRLPDLNVGTNSGASASGDLAETLVKALADGQQFDVALNGRFKGGFITRHCGDPEEAVHAVQLEMVQANYMSERPPFSYGAAKTEPLRGILRDALNTLLTWSPSA
jgi:N-formylglutamate deformylase